MESSSTTLGEASENPSLPHENELSPPKPHQFNNNVVKIKNSSSSEVEQASQRAQSGAHVSVLVRHPPTSDSLCPITGASHSSLLQFDLHICPRCHKHIYDSEEDGRSGNLETSVNENLTTGNSKENREGNSESDVGGPDQIEQIQKDVGWLRYQFKRRMSLSDLSTDDDGDQDENSDGDELRNLKSPGDGLHELNGMEPLGKSEDAQPNFNAEAPSLEGFNHDIEFRDEGDHYLYARPLERPFNLADARKGLDHHARKTIAKITTIITTNHPDDDSRSERERLKIVKSGLMRNPQVRFRTIKQKMFLRSKQIIKVLQKIVTYYPGVNMKADTLLIWSPFCILAHHLSELQAFKNTFDGKDDHSTEIHQGASALAPSQNQSPAEKCSEITFNHLEQLFYFLKSNPYTSQLDVERARHSQTPPVCTFAMMWLLYKPGTTVYRVNPAGGASAYVVERCFANFELPESDDLLDPFTLVTWNISYDGVYLRRTRQTSVIGPFDGERPILDLQFIPSRFVDASDGGKTRERLIKDGQKWYRMLTGAQQWHYSGKTLSFDKKVIDTRVVIDMAAYLQNVSQPRFRENFSMDDMGDGLALCVCEKCRGARPHPPRDFPWAEYDMINPTNDNLELPEGYPDRQHRYLLCSGRLVGFALRTRTWESLDVQRCYPPKINVKAIDTLVMPEERKRMIKAVVQKYTDPRFTPGKSGPTWGADFIEKKGEGQIFLLHGGPGVGKTYTAECISELIGRPLLSLTCADFGTNEEVMESKLSLWFKLAEKWGAVMLLDEADVWLERRMISDLKRNTLVAVFLRCLEYYRGILFLTSNRVGTFDDAFISRIHVVIYYEDLGEPQRKQIWKQFFDKLERERKNTIIIESRAKHFVLNDSEMKNIPWNGREIRNAFQTAVSLAEYRYHYEGGKEESDTVVLDKVDFEQVCQMSVDFKEYMKKVHGGDDENDRAMRQRTRA